MSNYADAQQVFPLVASPTNCSGVFGTPIIANTTGTRICGVQTNRTIAENCCGSAGVQDYQCWLYCASNSTINNWAQCVSRYTDSPVSWGPFCQEDAQGNTTESLKTSSAFRIAAPKTSWIVLALLFGFLFIGPTHAGSTIIHSLDPNNDKLTKRQNSGSCTFHIDRNYTTIGRSRSVSPMYDCTNSASTSFCAFETEVSTPVDGNNRTINGTSASEPKYDNFFENVVGNATMGRSWPAMSSVSLKRGFVSTPGQTVYLAWTPTLLCVNGTVTGCGSMLEGAGDGSYVEVCGPTYVDNAHEKDGQIQGIINAVYTN